MTQTSKEADRCAELEEYLQQAKDDYELALKENAKLQAVVTAARYWREYPTTPNAANLCGAIDALDAHDEKNHGQDEP